MTYFLKIFRILKRKGLLDESDARISKMNAQNQHVKTQYFFLDDVARCVQDRMTVSIKHFVSCYGIRKYYRNITNLLMQCLDSIIMNFKM